MAITEGGYDLQGLAEGLRETIDALDARAGLKAGFDDNASGGRPVRVTADTTSAARGEATLQAVLPVLSPHWQL